MNQRVVKYSAIVLFLIALVCVGTAVMLFIQERELSVRGIQGEAVVTGKRVTRAWRSGTRRETYIKSRMVSYRFEAEGRQVSDTSFVSKAYYERTSRGAHVPVWYLPDDPETSSVDPGYSGNQPYWAGGVGLIFALIAYGLIALNRLLERANAKTMPRNGRAGRSV